MSRTNYNVIPSGTKVFTMGIYDTKTKEKIKSIGGITANSISKQLLKYFDKDIFLIIVPQKIIK